MAIIVKSSSGHFLPIFNASHHYFMFTIRKNIVYKIFTSILSIKINIYGRVIASEVKAPCRCTRTKCQYDNNNTKK